MRKVVLIGGAGAPNYGDELIVKGWLEFFSKNGTECQVTFYENIADKVKSLHGESKHVKFKDDLVKVAKSYTKVNFWEQVIRGYYFIDNGGVEKYKHFDLQPLFDAEVVHLHGGGYLNNYDPEKGFYIGLLAALSKKYSIKAVATGIGFGPAPEPHNNQIKLLDEIFSHFEIFELRDVDNYRWLSNKFSNGCFVNGLDDCYLYAIDEVVEYKEDLSRLYLSFLSYNIDKIGDQYWAELAEFAKNYDEVIFFESYPWQDKDVFNKIKKKLPNVQVLNVADSLYKKIPISKNDYAVCSRFHVHFILARAGVNGVFSKDSKYYNVKHQSILDRGSAMSYSSFDRFDFKRKEGKSFIEKNDVMLHQQKIQLCKEIYS